MTGMNLNYMKVKESYLFADIRRRIEEWQKENPGKKVLRLGIGDVTQPLTPSVIRALHEAVEEQAHAETFHGYMPECGDPALRKIRNGNAADPGGAAGDSGRRRPEGDCAGTDGADPETGKLKSENRRKTRRFFDG